MNINILNTQTSSVSLNKVIKKMLFLFKTIFRSNYLDVLKTYVFLNKSKNNDQDQKATAQKNCSKHKKAIKINH